MGLLEIQTGQSRAKDTAVGCGEARKGRWRAVSPDSLQGCEPDSLSHISFLFSLKCLKIFLEFSSLTSGLFGSTVCLVAKYFLVKFLLLISCVCVCTVVSDFL